MGGELGVVESESSDVEQEQVPADVVPDSWPCVLWVWMKAWTGSTLGQPM